MRQLFSVGKDQARDFSAVFGFSLVVVFFLISAYISYHNTQVLREDEAQVTQTFETIKALDDLVSLAKDAETGQRGYVITGDEKYLAPYDSAVQNIGMRLAELDRVALDKPELSVHLPSIKAHIEAKMKELAQTVALRRNEGFEAARNVVVTDKGKNEMDAIRNEVGAMQEDQRQLRQQRLADMDSAFSVAMISGLLASLSGLFLTLVVVVLVQRAAHARQRQDWLQTGQVGLNTALSGEYRVEQLGENILKFFANYFDAHAAAIYTKNGEGFRRISTFGVPAESNTPERFLPSDGLLGQVANQGQAIIVRDVPEGYLTVGSALGKGRPRHLIIAPMNADGVINGVVEFGFIHPINELTIELLNRTREDMGLAVRSASYRAHLQNLLEETQRQSEELQVQSEELRVSNEELEEQSNALKASQVQLEQQQVELEQTNTQLEEQTQLLETQKDDLAQSKVAVQIKAHELEQSSRYKSDFLANMSHELRTPLNSSLILAKLLADNREGNLTEEQIKYAQTIQTSGNDLLVLINDILDLSKIEAGHMEINADSLSLTSLTNDLLRIFQPIAEEKQLKFHVHLAPECPKNVTTDRLRLEQVLKNLLSNAFKFTEKGKVELLIQSAEKSRVSFAVNDSGIGISAEQQTAIFDAFRQADNTISRKYGGTGLGLSISRELVRLLGGSIQLVSTPGQGSTFTVVIPEIYDEKSGGKHIPVGEQIPLLTLEPTSERPTHRPTKQRKIRRIEDDRDVITAGSRVILAVEDDEAFARIIYDLAHELKFQCLIATTAEDALATIKQYTPSAVILDVGLPDHSGLVVLDRLKNNPHTRHIPVHVVSVDDYAQTALSLGALGYIFKPVKREELTAALKKLENKFSTHVRRVLIVEDDPTQRESMRKLLGSHDIETVGVGTANKCLAHLREATFDCMVLDLSLPDASGYSLLETLSQEDAYSFPPVIVYTGRDLSSEDEQRLRRYSKSIIIKGAKSPERLLDEVMLFLHQVVSDLPSEQQAMLQKARSRDAMIEGKNILIVEDDVRNVYAVTGILEPCGAKIQIARNGKEALKKLEVAMSDPATAIDLVLMDVMMPEMDGLTATEEIRKRNEWRKLPIIMLTAKAMKNDQERCLNAGANDYMSKPIDVEKLLSLVRVWMPR